MYKARKLAQKGPQVDQKSCGSPQMAEKIANKQTDGQIQIISIVKFYMDGLNALLLYCRTLRINNSYMLCRIEYGYIDYFIIHIKDQYD